MFFFVSLLTTSFSPREIRLDWSLQQTVICVFICFILRWYEVMKNKDNKRDFSSARVFFRGGGRRGKRLQRKACDKFLAIFSWKEEGGGERCKAFRLINVLLQYFKQFLKLIQIYINVLIHFSFMPNDFYHSHPFLLLASSERATRSKILL